MSQLQTFSGNGGSELCESRGSGPCETTADEPDQEGDARRRDIGVNRAGRREDAAADDDAHDNAKGLDGSEIPRE
jgi:hypothetical protein